MNRGKYNNSPIAIFYNYSGSISCIFENSIEDLNFRAIQRCIKQISTKRKNSGGKKIRTTRALRSNGKSHSFLYRLR